MVATKEYYTNTWWARPVALVYVLTIGIVVGVVITILGTIYGIIGTIMRLLGMGERPSANTRRPIGGPLSATMRWWTDNFAFAILGRGHFQFTPTLFGGD